MTERFDCRAPSRIENRLATPVSRSMDCADGCVWCYGKPFAVASILVEHRVRESCLDRKIPLGFPQRTPPHLWRGTASPFFVPSAANSPQANHEAPFQVTQVDSSPVVASEMCAPKLQIGLPTNRS